MTEFAFDVALVATVHVDADHIRDALALAHLELLDLDTVIEIGGQLYPDGTVGLSGQVTGISRGLLRDVPGALLMTLGGIDGHGAARTVALDAMARPHVCDRFQQDKPSPNCHLVYDEAAGSGYAGLCPACADHTPA